LLWTILTLSPNSPHNYRGARKYNLKSQIVRAATSVALNIAEGSTSQTDTEQARFLGLSIRSLVETVACQHIISRRNLLADKTLLRQAYRDAEKLVARLHALRKAIAPEQAWLREDPVEYAVDDEEREIIDENPF
jgi:four helix bundle protein